MPAVTPKNTNSSFFHELRFQRTFFHCLGKKERKKRGVSRHIRVKSYVSQEMCRRVEEELGIRYQVFGNCKVFTLPKLDDSYSATTADCRNNNDVIDITDEDLQSWFEIWKNSNSSQRVHFQVDPEWSVDQRRQLCNYININQKKLYGRVDREEPFINFCIQ
jgi:hypothetical protein